MSLPESKPIKNRPRIAFFGAGIGFRSEKGGHQGLPLITALLERLAVDFEVVTYSLIRVQHESVPQGIKLRQISRWKLPLYLKYGLLVMSFITDHLFRRFTLINAISAYPAGRLGIILGRILRRPVMVHLIGSETAMIEDIGYGDLLNPRLQKIVEWVCKRADVLITVSDYQRKVAEKNMPLLKRTITVLPRRPDIGKFPYTEREVSFPVKFLHVASYQPFKDQSTLFYAFAAITLHIECSLTVVGHGFDISVVRKLINDLGIEGRVQFAGIVNHGEIGRYYRDTHILLHTSRYEGLPGVVPEAMASGLPVCGTSVGILDDLGAPFVVAVPPQRPNDLAEQTLKLIRDPARYQLQQRLAREYLEHHDADWSAKNYKATFEHWIKE